AVAAIARLVGTALQLGLETAIALAVGLAIGSVATVRATLLGGAAPAARFALRIGITLLGARLTLGQLIETGGVSVLAIVVVVSVALVLGTALARRFGVNPPLSALITVGMAICGNSAILALSPIVRAPNRETAYAVSTITLFGLVGVLLLPILGAALGLSDATFGTWAGLAVNDTAQVVATGYAFSPPAGDVATVVKLTRNLAILPVLLGATWLAVRNAAAEGESTGPTAASASPTRLVARAVPWFVIGFVVFAGLRSAGLLDGALPTGGTLADLCSTVATLLILVALAGVGISTDVRAMLGVGARPFLLGASMWIVIGVLGLVLAIVVAGGPGAAAAAVYHAG
ncbi:MAG TPA: putative sulfate exporter family transporter, partial [Methylomirabilota bacterium]|nr:putative sulfate exporter family transporter [Methylomirabilota bacterium]